MGSILKDRPDRVKNRNPALPFPEKPFGLGDAVESVAQPIAKAIDAVLGTHVTGCGGCAQRKAYLNSLMPRFPALTRKH